MIRSTRPAAPGDVARHYDELDRFYREFWGEHLHHGLFENRREDPQMAAARLVERVAERAGIGPGMVVCDVGCGYGATARLLAVQFAARVRGITLSGAQIEVARALRPEVLPVEASLDFDQGDWLARGYPDSMFDAVVAIECLTHMPDQRAFFEEAARTLKPGGRLVVCAWLTCEDPGPLRSRFLLEPICREGELPGMASVSETRAFIREAGLELLQVEDLSRMVRRTWSISARRMLGGVVRDAELRRLLRDPGFRSRAFAAAVFRIWLAYRVGAMRYGLFVARRPEVGRG